MWLMTDRPTPPFDQHHSLPIGNRMDGKVVTIINRSEIVGRPLGALLANDGQWVFWGSFACFYLYI